MVLMEVMNGRLAAKMSSLTHNIFVWPWSSQDLSHPFHLMWIEGVVIGECQSHSFFGRELGLSLEDEDHIDFGVGVKLVAEGLKR